jgi:hypothetical protein
MARITIRYCPLCPEKIIVARRVAARLRAEWGAGEVEMRRGHLGELSVEVDGRRVVDTHPFWFAWTDPIVEQVRASLSAPAG